VRIGPPGLVTEQSPVPDAVLNSEAALSRLRPEEPDLVGAEKGMEPGALRLPVEPSLTG